MPQIPYSSLTPTTTLQHLGYLNSIDFSYIFQLLQKWSQIPLGLYTSNIKIYPASGGPRPPGPHQRLCPWTPLRAKPPDHQIGSR